MDQKVSSIAVDSVQRPQQEYFKMPTWGLLVVLVAALVILKTFIYIKDPTRDGK